MRGLVFRSLGAVVILAFLLASLSCARDQQLVSITVKPDTENFGAADPALNVQLRALGTYIHPPVTKDITDQVVWNSNTPNMVTVNSTGLLAPAGFACGNALVSATVTTNHSNGNRSSSGALVTGYMTANVACLSSTGPVLTVNFLGTGTGNITSSPAGLSCASTAGTCSAGFVSGTPVTLTATPTGTSTSVTWGNCPTPSGLVCTIPSLTTSTVISATFQ
jgi:Bacterial Ig-like domain (group 2)